MTAPPSGFGKREWVLARPLYRFARFEMPTVPRAQRGPALELQIRQWAPYARAGSYVAWEGDDALVWTWDRARVEAAMAESGVKGELPVVPETLLAPRGSNDVQLVQCLEGCEGQVWRDGQLVASRWWPAMPTAPEWRNFQKDAGVPPEEQRADVAQPSVHAWVDRPWARSGSLAGIATSAAKRERWLVPVTALCLLAATAWYGAQWLKLDGAIAERRAALDALNRKAEPILAARGEALQALDRITALQSALDRYPDQLTLMSRVAQAVTNDGSFLRQWDFANGKLKLEVSSARDVQTRDWVSRFESLGAFRNVQAVPGNDPKSLTLTMDVLAPGETRVAANEGGAPR